MKLNGVVKCDLNKNKIYVGNVEVSMEKALSIKKMYELVQEIEFIKENFDVDDNEIWDIAIDVREKIDKVDINEIKIIEEVLDKRK